MRLCPSTPADASSTSRDTSSSLRMDPSSGCPCALGESELTLTARVWSRSPRAIRSLLVVVGGIMIAVAGGGPAGAAEADLHSGLAHLRAGAQAQAERDLLKYRDGLRDSDARRSIDRVLPLLRRPLTEDVREY